jgi:hypothetical protein
VGAQLRVDACSELSWPAVHGAYQVQKGCTGYGAFLSGRVWKPPEVHTSQPLSPVAAL